MSVDIECPECGEFEELRDYICSDCKNANLLSAVRELYYAAHWTPDRPVKPKLWERLRDEAGFTPGGSPEPIDCRDTVEHKLVACIEELLDLDIKSAPFLQVHGFIPNYAKIQELLGDEDVVSARERHKCA